jgi:PAP_fibrillin
VALTIEPNQSRTGKSASECTPEELIPRPIRGIMTNYGYLLPDPNVPNRVSVWFTGGSLEVNDEEKDLEEWKEIFGENAPNRDMSEFARVLAAKVLLGATVPDHMEENGTLNYTLKRPIGGHGTAFCDVLYMDEKLRVMRGHTGSVFVFHKVKYDEVDQI